MEEPNNIQSTDAPHDAFRSGFVALIGRANVGKSTLLNALVGEKLSIVSPKPHTTRHRLLGVLNGDGFQVALLDTPGYLRKGRDALDAAMSRQLREALADADLAVLVVEPRMPGDVERELIAQLDAAKMPSILAINKVDTASKPRLLPVIQAYAEAHGFVEIVPVSAAKEDGLDVLVEQMVRLLPEQEAVFPPETLTDRGPAFRYAEVIREKAFLLYGQEIPYYVAVEIEDYEARDDDRPDVLRATIYVDKPSQRQLLIGTKGQALKEVGMQARVDIEKLVGKPVFLELWVKVNPKWRRKAGFVQRLL